MDNIENLTEEELIEREKIKAELTAKKDLQVAEWKEKIKGYVDLLPDETCMRYIGIYNNIYKKNHSEEDIVKLLFENFSLGKFRIEPDDEPLY